MAKPQIPTRIALFDDSKAAFETFESKFQGLQVEIKWWNSSLIDPAVLQQLREFNPHLIVVDLLLGESRATGFKVLEELAKAFPETPSIVYSKLISNTKDGDQVREISRQNGAKGALSKIDNLSAADFLKFASLNSVIDGAH